MKDVKDLEKFKDKEMEYDRYYIDSRGKKYKVEGPFKDYGDEVPPDVCAKIIVNKTEGKIGYFAKFAGSYLFDPKEVYRHSMIKFLNVSEDKFKAYCLFLETQKGFLLTKAERL